MRSVNFTVDAALLRELGSRLVGKPHIALAELIKNSYDADARHVQVTFTDDSIVVEDDGHGMSVDNFIRYWMRVGTTHKAAEKTSPELSRALTGSKGVGRLAAQLLARELRVESVGLVDPALKGYATRSTATDNAVSRTLNAVVDWEAAVQQGELTSVRVPIFESDATMTFAAGSRIGTRLVLTGLRDSWDEDDFRGLAREIWALQPPFEVSPDDEAAFTIDLTSPYGPVKDEFRDQMEAIFRNWQGRITLELVDDEPDADVLFEFDALKDYDEEEDDEEEAAARAIHDGAGQSTRRRPGGLPRKLLKLSFGVRRPAHVDRTQLIRVVDCPIDHVEAEIRIFSLQHRQADGLSVNDSRRWMANFGGVHIYDDGFRLPYYGPEDWLHIERDHARRLSRSQLVPATLRVSKAMQDLPSRRRIFGSVTVSTAREQRSAESRGVTENQALAIQVTRDRLTDNVAFKALSNVVRLGLDLYSTEVARAKAVAGTKRTQAAPPPKPSAELAAVREAVTAASESIPRVQLESINDYLSGAEQKVADLERSREVEASLLGSLATVGMTTLAWEHESTKQRLVILNAAKALSAAVEGGDYAALSDVVRFQAAALRESANRLSDIAGMFRSVLDREARETITSLKAKRFIERTARQLTVLARGATVSVASVPEGVELPPGTFAGWSAVFQNLLINAFNAVLEEPTKQIDVDFTLKGKVARIRVQDTGVGVDLTHAERYFLPFERGLADDRRRAQMGLGGAGLGLTIVRMIADTMDVTVRFIPPETGYSTAVAVEWEVKS